MDREIVCTLGDQVFAWNGQAQCDSIGLDYAALPAAKHLFNIDRYGNTGSAGWVSVLSESLAEKRFASGDQLLVSVYGGGLAWGSLLARAA